MVKDIESMVLRKCLNNKGGFVKMKYNDYEPFNRLYHKVDMAIRRGTYNFNNSSEAELLMADYIKHKNDYMKSANYLKQQIMSLLQLERGK